MSSAEHSDNQVPPTGLPATLAECHQLIRAQALHIEQLLGRLAQFEGQLTVLQERLALDSKNSSKPPSSDGPAATNRAQRRATGRKRGAQFGHQGNFRALLDESEVDQVVDCAPASLCECGAVIELSADEPIRHQVFDVPLVKAQVMEYRRYAGCCTACGKTHRAALPVGVPSGQIGPRALALVGTLGTHFHLTQLKTRDLMAWVLGVDFSVGAISQAQGKVALALAAPLTEVAQFAKQAPVKHMDETRYPREGAGNWVWAVVTPTVAWYSLLPSRARYVATSLVGEKFSGILVSDRYAVYDYVDADKRQVCWAHLLRDFTRISQRRGLAGQVGRGLLGAGFIVFRWRKQGKNKQPFEPLRKRVKRLLLQGATQTQCTRTAKTCANLLRLEPALWTFLDNAAVAPTNNDAERALRALVLKRKISGPTRSKRGDDFLASGFSVYETCRRQGRDLWSFMHQAVVAWIDRVAAPSLLPSSAAIAPSG
jgi:transposase